MKCITPNCLESPRRDGAGVPRTTAIAVVALAVLVLAALGRPAEATQRRMAWAITGATVITAPGSTLEDATVVLRDGLIEAVGTDVTAPADARVIDGTDMTVYAGWIDAASVVAILEEDEAAPGTPGARGRGGRGGGSELQMLELGAPGVNERVRAEFDQADNLDGENDDIAAFRNAGFTAALVLPQEGIYRGRGVLVALRQAEAEEMILAEDVAQTIGFSTGGFGRGYPSSAMGVVSLIRQVLLDTQRQATWENSYDNDPSGLPRPEANPAYTALMPVLAGEQPVIFDASNTREARRALAIAQEFGLVPIIKGNGNEYEMADELAQAQASAIVPLDYPDAPDIGDADTNLDVGLEALKRWEDAPGNAAALERAGVTFAFTSEDVRPADFAANLRRAIEAGLSEDAALAALTTAPARMFGVDAIVGTIEAGKVANLVVATGAPFAEDTEVRHVFVDGFHTAAQETSGGGRSAGPVEPRGTWAVTMGNADFSRDSTWRITGEPGSYAGTVDGRPFDSIELNGNELTVTITSEMGRFAVDVTIAGDSLRGSMSAQGFTMNISGRRTSGPGPVAIAYGDGGQQ